MAVSLGTYLGGSFQSGGVSSSRLVMLHFSVIQCLRIGEIFFIIIFYFTRSFETLVLKMN